MVQKWGEYVAWRNIFYCCTTCSSLHYTHTIPRGYKCETCVHTICTNTQRHTSKPISQILNLETMSVGFFASCFFHPQLLLILLLHFFMCFPAQLFSLFSGFIHAFFFDLQKPQLLTRWNSEYNQCNPWVTANWTWGVCVCEWMYYCITCRCTEIILLTSSIRWKTLDQHYIII